ncbi:MAG TPA: NADPH-dependent FMN reductase [Candidatus Polarisedimenticolia bacterium]|nr:NADPH-dependent FMN reductase [Candidatus Polarisedimenticolia bacterium]
MVRILGIAGSLRKASYNTALLRAAAELAPAGTQIEIASLAGIPLYDGDEEAANGSPAAVTQLKERVAGAAGLILATPEYNHSLPGVFKNAIDWLSRPGSDIPRVFGDRPVALTGATPGPGGTRLAQVAWLPVLRVLGMRHWCGRQLYVAGAGSVFDADGRLVDQKIREQLEKFTVGFATFVGG